MFAKVIRTHIRRFTAMLLLFNIFILATPAVAHAVTPCGKAGESYTPSIEIGCTGRGEAFQDLMFAVIRFLSAGVGLVLVGSTVYAGIQYTGSRGDPNANAEAVKRIQSNVTALFIFVFAYAIINYVVPGAFLRS